MDADQLNFWNRFWRGAMMIVVLACFVAPAAAQTVTPITPPAEISDTLAAGDAHTYSFSATAGGVFSFSVRSQSDLDPVVTLLDSAGRTVLSNDDYDYPDTRDALLEAVTMPRTGTYTVRVSGFGETAGAYDLRVYPGFSQMAAAETFDVAEGWEADDALNASVTGGMYNLEVSGVRAMGASFYQYVDPTSDIYVQTRVTAIDSESGWMIGLAMRQSDDGYYALVINHEGLWRFALVDDDDVQIIRDWTPHPQIVPGQTQFTLGMIGNAASFDFFYNNGYIGSVSDASLSAPGSVGVVVGTLGSLASTTSATIDDFIVTTPRYIDGERVIPAQVIVSSGAEMERALEVRHVVDASGAMALTVPSSTVEYARDGVNRLMLGRGTTYGNFAMGAMLNIQAARSGIAGCGLVVRYSDEGDYVLAFLDQTGGYGLSQRDDDAFIPGVYGENPQWGQDSAHLLIIADDTTLYYYIDGNLVGSLQTTAGIGEVGIAVVNYETITTVCQYSDVWLWRWD
jgi:hypothetical protein